MRVETAAFERITLKKINKIFLMFDKEEKVLIFASPKVMVK